MQYHHSIVWLRRDLRLSDHTALHHALTHSDRVSLIFIFDESILNKLPHDDRRVTFIWQALDDMDEQLLRHHRTPIHRFYGRPDILIPEILVQSGADALFFNHDYEPEAIRRDERVAALSAKIGTHVASFKDQVIFERSEILKDDGTPYKVFTAYKNRWIADFIRTRTPGPQRSRMAWHKLASLSVKVPTLREISDLGFSAQSSPIIGGEQHASMLWKAFRTRRLSDYAGTRDLPATDGTSGLSPYLRFGNISIRQLANELQTTDSKGSQIFLSELIWREFFMMILYHFPHVIKKNFNPSYDRVRWLNRPDWFEAWKSGRTGYPIVDAGMRQLNETGLMHNRVRMITASFLVKHLHIDWTWGEQYFARHLLDYELSSNNGNWQWAAGTGVDAAPYFRIFNPISQQKKFDAEAEYIKRWVPELRDLSPKDIHSIPRRDRGVLANYPEPVCDLDDERRLCIQLYRP